MVRESYTTDFWVVIPFYNERKLIRDTLEALRTQSDNDFSVVCVNNASTDSSAKLIRDYAASHSDFRLHLINEPQKGTGAAADTGFRYAIDKGAVIIARTDADTIPCANWIKLIKADFRAGKRLVAGRIQPRTDEPQLRWFDPYISKGIMRSVERAPTVFSRRKGQKYGLFMLPGANMAIEAKLYVQVGGFPRTSIDDTDEDFELHQKVSRVLTRHEVKLNKKIIVYASLRKVWTMGYIRIILWYWGRKYRPKVIDVR